MVSIAKLEQLLNQYKKQLQCDFSLYDPKFECLVTTNTQDQMKYDDQKTIVSIEAGVETFHLATPDKRDKDFLLLVAIACKSILETERSNLTTNQQIEMAFKGLLTPDELDSLDQRDGEVSKQIFLLEFDKEMFEDCKTVIENMIEGDVFNINDDFLILMKSPEDSVDFAHLLINTINSELMIKAVCCISEKFSSIKEIYEIRKSLQQLARLRNIFYPATRILDNKGLGLAKVIATLTEEQCNQLSEEMANFDFQNVDNEEDLQTIYAFFENDLNSSKTAQKLFLHRNTLIYRLEKYQKLSGLDIRKFEDAVRFKIALMMYQYLKK